MNFLVDAITSWMWNSTSQSKEHNWLSSSKDLVQLEHRQRMIQTGKAPWQITANENLKGWV